MRSGLMAGTGLGLGSVGSKGGSPFSAFMRIVFRYVVDVPFSIPVFCRFCWDILPVGSWRVAEDSMISL